MAEEKAEFTIADVVSTTSIKDTIFIDPPMKKWRCSKGHEWEAKWTETIQFSWAGFQSPQYCMRCLHEVLAAKCGVVTEVVDD